MSTGEQVPWLETSPADFDRRRLVKGYRPPRDDQPGLFYVPAPTAERKPAQDVQLDGQGSLFGEGVMSAALLPCGHGGFFLLASGDCGRCLDVAWLRDQDIAYDRADHCRGDLP